MPALEQTADMMRTILLAALAACLAVLPAAALTIRPDRDDAEYLELATRYPSAIALGAAGGGVLVNSRWVLTAAHRARPLKPRERLRIDARDIEIAAVYLHPGWKSGAENDIALLLLKSEVLGIAATPVYRAGDENGKGAIVVGQGGGKKRAAINTVDRVAPLTLGLRLKPLDEASDLQGALSAAETGAPLFVEIGGEILVAGVAHGTADGWETYARASAFGNWVEATMLEVARREAQELLE